MGNPIIVYICLRIIIDSQDIFQEHFRDKLFLLNFPPVLEAVTAVVAVPADRNLHVLRKRHFEFFVLAKLVYTVSGSETRHFINFIKSKSRCSMKKDGN